MMGAKPRRHTRAPIDEFQQLTRQPQANPNQSKLMKPNRLFHHLRLMILCLPPVTAPAADPAPAPAPAAAAYHYTGEIQGVACAACSRTVKVNLEKMPGVTKVKVIPGKPSGTARLEITASSPGLTRADAVKALGEHADDFQIQSLQRAAKP